VEGWRVVGGWHGEEMGFGLGYGDRVVCFFKEEAKDSINGIFLS
jgi:hypothetical protein